MNYNTVDFEFNVNKITAILKKLSLTETHRSQGYVLMADENIVMRMSQKPKLVFSLKAMALCSLIQCSRPLYRA